MVGCDNLKYIKKRRRKRKSDTANLCRTSSRYTWMLAFVSISKMHHVAPPQDKKPLSCGTRVCLSQIAINKNVIIIKFRICMIFELWSLLDCSPIIQFWNSLLIWCPLLTCVHCTVHEVSIHLIILIVNNLHSNKQMSFDDW